MATFMDRFIADLKTLANTVTTHIDDLVKHITAAERNTWNGKQNAIAGQNDRVVVKNSSGIVESSTEVSISELNTLKDVDTSTTIKAQLATKAPSSHVGDSTHITAAERNTWNGKSNLYVIDGTHTLTGDQSNTVVYVTHTQNKVPKMVFAYMESYTKGSGGDDDMAATGPVTLYVFATVPMESGKASTTRIALLVPDVTTSSGTKIHWSALF